VNASKAQKLLSEAAAEAVRLDRHLLVAAALRDVLTYEPVVVGGTAQEHYSAADYHETDLDLCVPLTRTDRDTLRALGFVEEGRHWVHGPSNVPVEFPETRIDGDESRIRRIKIRSGVVAIIGVEDLYLDRVRQGTAYPGQLTTSRSFHSAVAIGSASFDVMDWTYIRRKIAQEVQDSGVLGTRMRDIDKAVRKTIRRTQ
jgi:hypothetical protein